MEEVVARVFVIAAYSLSIWPALAMMLRGAWSESVQRWSGLGPMPWSAAFRLSYPAAFALGVVYNFTLKWPGR